MYSGKIAVPPGGGGIQKLEVSLDWKKREVVLSRGYGNIQQSIVRAEVFAGKMKSTHSVAVIPTL
jgi:hypothetical protein